MDLTHSVKIIRPSEKLRQQIAAMVDRSEDYIEDADGIDPRVHIVVNDYDYGVWLCLHHDLSNMHEFMRLQRLA